MIVRHLLGITALLAVVNMLPAAAASPDACSQSAPTGAPLPRSATLDSGVRTLLAGPRMSTAPVARILNGQHVTVIQECGALVEVRTDDGKQGWLPVNFSTHEATLYDHASRAAHHPPARPEITSVAECRQQVKDPVAQGLCRTRVEKGLSWP